jgi:hypothetical protein
MCSRTRAGVAPGRNPEELFVLLLLKGVAEIVPSQL